MIQFSSIKVLSDGASLEIMAYIPDDCNPRKTLTIDKVAIQDSNHYSVLYPDSPQVELNDLFGFIPGDIKVNLHIKIKDLEAAGITNTGLFFVYVHQAGIPDPNVPCSCTVETGVGIAVNLFPLYNVALKSLYGDGGCGNCADNSKLIDIYVKKEAIMNAIEINDHSTAI
jgi:hypothetical protein